MTEKVTLGNKLSTVVHRATKKDFAYSIIISVQKITNNYS